MAWQFETAAEALSGLKRQFTADQYKADAAAIRQAIAQLKPQQGANGVFSG